MNSNHQPTAVVRTRWKSKGWIAPVAFVAGSLLTAGLMHANQVRADSNRVYQLLVYHAVPGKVPALETRFRDAAKLQAKHGLNAVGYWVPDDDPTWANTFIYLVAHPSREEAKKNWASFHADPAFQEYVKSEQADPLIVDVDDVYMRPTDFSAMK